MACRCLGPCCLRHPCIVSPECCLSVGKQHECSSAVQAVGLPGPLWTCFPTPETLAATTGAGMMVGGRSGHILTPCRLDAAGRPPVGQLCISRMHLQYVLVEGGNIILVRLTTYKLAFQLQY